MLSTTTERVANNTSEEYRQQFEQQLRQNISRYMHADRQTIDRRIEELDREWNLERAIELEAPSMIALGVVLGLTHNRKWFGLSVFAASMVILHNTQGWYPLLRVFQRMGMRSQNDIEQERQALRVLRKDHLTYTRH
jgi:hypothetical protein